VWASSAVHGVALGLDLEFGLVAEAVLALHPNLSGASATFT